MKNLYFENQKKFNAKNSIYFGDWRIEDPTTLNSKIIQKLKKRVISDYHWNSATKLKKDYLKLKKFRKKMLGLIINKLNKYHETNYNEKYWKIIILPWLTMIIYILYDKWEMVRSIKKPKNYKAHAYCFQDSDFIFEDFSDMNWYHKNTNLWLITKILAFRNNLKFDKKIKIKNDRFKHKNSLTTKLFKKITEYFFRFFSLFFKNKIFINNISLSKIDTIFFNLRLKQFPFFWLKPDYKNNSVDIEKRKRFLQIKRKNNNKNFENFFCNILYLIIPKSYVENYQSIKSSVNGSYWPKKCKKIITAYEFKVNEQFKIWSAEKVIGKAKYILLQHGGGFGLNEFEAEEDLQTEISDLFLTWGWGAKKKNIKAFNAFLLNNHKIKLTNNKKNNILIPLHNHGKFSFAISSYPKTNFDRLKKVNQIQLFVENLKIPESNKIILRYIEGNNSVFYNKFNENYFNKKTIIDRGHKKFYDVMNTSKITVHDLNSTTFLQTLFLNQPTILILDKNIDRTRKKYLYLMRLLEKVKIVHYCPIKAAEFVNKNINNLNIWWSDNKLQCIRKIFCSKFVKDSNNSIGELEKFLI